MGISENHPPNQQRCQGLSRVYILLPTGAPVPPLVTISQQPLTPNQSPHPTKGAAALVTPVSATSPAAPVPVPKTDDLAHPKEHDTPLVTITVKPLPAIYPANLTTTTPGKRGVLHTIWARLKLSSLRLEMEAERRQNNESIGLEMALQEYAWLAGHFGLPRLIVTDDGEAKEEEEVPASPPTATSPSAESPVSPRGPVSPGRGGRLSEKLKGLKLATSPADLNNPSIKTSILQGRAMSPATTTDLNAALSLNAIMKGVTPEDQTPHEDELFALPMSPRSPEMKRSPFSMLA